ncbi:Sec-independent protein translocase subunit TatA [Saccharopolyspora sp. 6M]|uniref:Sec-independent protein translocase subunit TatA n=1 Tax=Saccharopolyspora sp. 6M TaxID=2877237 RepID=UPI001CD4590F|nr:Sec-independent protein translocase subunit TatA [Saccharopolyspora sp. 6M]MCA1228951.1 Sec-independent protein translocase subunit TatA [Saccharopolyspora sp. 6M]
MTMPGGWQLVLVLGVLVLLFGSNKLPEVARSLGRSARVLKAETRGLREDEDAAAQVPAAQEPIGPEPVPQRSATAPATAAEPARETTAG